MLEDVLNRIDSRLRGEGDERRVFDVMVSDPVTVGPQTPVAEAYEVMMEGSFRHLPVVADGKLSGMLSERDILEAMPGVGAAPSEHGQFTKILVDSIMIRSPLTVGIDEPLVAAARAMVNEKVGAVIVVDDGERVLGIVTTIDITEALIQLLE